MIFEGGTNIFIRSFEAFGFYVKKIFLPLPLNVAIVEVDPLYAIVGIITLCLLVVTFRRSGIPGIFFATAALFTLPALIVATTSNCLDTIRRALSVYSICLCSHRCLELIYRYLVRWNAVKWFVPLVSIIIFMASIVTFQRGILWGDNLAMLEDIVAKSPNFGVARNEYGVL